MLRIRFGCVYMQKNVKVMLEQNVGLEALTRIAPGQNTKAKIVKRVSSWRPAGITWVRLEQSRAAALTPSTATTTRTTRNTSAELSWERAKAISLAGGTAICLVLDRLDIAYNLREANRETRLKRIARCSLKEPKFVWTVPLPRDDAEIGEEV